MESPPDPASDPGNSASEPVTPVRETPVNLETLRKADQPAPVRRQTCSSTNRESRELAWGLHAARVDSDIIEAVAFSNSMN
ncbi:Nuclear receptor ROR-alpha Nuclear receptor RZR-alpha [Channa argus]|uniref:Nuclear receptor ROR-alpha Nuclear receptor RZR-alpha n=1 Tax=Channa argus TaxID=215402 RepID=A0A6G1PFN6_CHAAH|nr:Nuclear receptor ROR-alpha Nuclear receptor RZR-alpha [Channa argus]